MYVNKMDKEQDSYLPCIAMAHSPQVTLCLKLVYILAYLFFPLHGVLLDLIVIVLYVIFIFCFSCREKL